MQHNSSRAVYLDMTKRNGAFLNSIRAAIDELADRAILWALYRDARRERCYCGGARHDVARARLTTLAGVALVAIAALLFSR